MDKFEISKYSIRFFGMEKLAFKKITNNCRVLEYLGLDCSTYRIHPFISTSFVYDPSHEEGVTLEGRTKRSIGKVNFVTRERNRSRSGSPPLRQIFNWRSI